MKTNVIACTVVGCIPVPRGCHPEIGYTPWGTPTGFDVAACPNYTLYGFLPVVQPTKLYMAVNSKVATVARN